MKISIFFVTFVWFGLVISAYLIPNTHLRFLLSVYLASRGAELYTHSLFSSSQFLSYLIRRTLCSTYFRSSSSVYMGGYL
jgi:hypothetical protein